MFVYAIACELGLVKIGKASNPARRLADLQIGSPVELVIWATKDCGSDAESESVERAIHQAIDRLHVRGEWFRASASDLRPFFPDIPDEIPVMPPERMALIEDFYTNCVPAYPDQTRRNLRLLHNADTDEQLIQTLIDKCATGRLAA